MITEIGALANCDRCQEEYYIDYLDEDGLCIDCQEYFKDEEYEEYCHACQGTGISLTGPPDVGYCSVCGGSGC